MKPWPTILAVMALTVVAAAIAVAREERAQRKDSVAPAEPLDVEALLWAIRQRESGDRPAAVGMRGERSAYQFRAATWAQHTAVDFIYAGTIPGLADKVARSHVAWIVAQLKRREIEALPEFVAAAWNRGMEHALDGARSDYAQAVATLYWYRRAEIAGGAR